MVSLQTTLSPKERPFYRSAATAAAAALIDPSKKRKRDNDQFPPEEELPPKELKLFFAPKSHHNRSIAALDFHLEEAPLPPDWQRCLDIESGQITFYNTRTRSRMTRDPRCGLGLDLDLNLACDPQSAGNNDDEEELESTNTAGEEKAMVAGVCMRCHMLVMMCRSSPSCPNCKFLHPPDAKQFLPYVTK